MTKPVIQDRHLRQELMELKAEAYEEVPEIKYELNAPIDNFVTNVKNAISLDIPQVKPYDIQTDPIAIVCGGPSLEGTFDDLKIKHENGMKVVSVNGSHDWLVDRGIRPSAHVLIDSRSFNSRFVENWQKDTKYLVASQAHPDVFDVLKGADVYLFHCNSTKEERDVLNEYYGDDYYTVVGGSTVTLRAIPLMRMLGFTRMELYGFDSCMMDDKHHAYPQSENDTKDIGVVVVDGREFVVATWMHSQAKEFIDIIKKMGDMFELEVHGDGLIAHILKTGAKLLEEK